MESNLAELLEVAGFFASIRMTRLSHRARLIGAFRLDLDINGNCLADARDRFSRRSKHQIEVAPVDRVGRHGPARPARFVDRREQFYMQRDRFGDAMDRKIAENIAAFRTGPFHAAALECHQREFFNVKELRAAQMVVSLFDSRVDAVHVYVSRNRGVIRMLAIDFDLATKLRELSMGGAEKLVHCETNRRPRRIELVCLVCRCDGT